MGSQCEILEILSLLATLGRGMSKQTFVWPCVHCAEMLAYSQDELEVIAAITDCGEDVVYEKHCKCGWRTQLPQSFVRMRLKDWANAPIPEENLLEA